LRAKNIVKLLFVIILLGGASGCLNTNTSFNSVSSHKPELRISELDRFELLLGAWRGRQPLKDGGLVEFTFYHYPDGLYWVEFDQFDGEGNREHNIEFGHWGVSGNILFTSYEGDIYSGQINTANLLDPYRHDAYSIVQLTDKKLVYQQVVNGNRYFAQKVKLSDELVSERYLLIRENL